MAWPGFSEAERAEIAAKVAKIEADKRMGPRGALLRAVAHALAQSATDLQAARQLDILQLRHVLPHLTGPQRAEVDRAIRANLGRIRA